MVSILKNHFSNIKWKINKKIDNTKQWISNLVLAILMTSWIGLTTKAEANIQHISYKSDFHKVVKWDGLLKIAKKYGLTVNELIELNKSNKFWKRNAIWDNSTIYLWSNLIIHKSNNSEILTAKKIDTLKILDNNKKNIASKVRAPIKHIEKKEESLIKKNNKIESKKLIAKFYSDSEEKEISTTEIKLNHAIKYSAMYEKQWKKYKKHYTISPSDTPIYTWNIKKISWKVYIEVRLVNDKDITWFVRLSSFDINSKNLIKQTLKKEKTNTEKKVTTKQNIVKIKEYIPKKIPKITKIEKNDIVKVGIEKSIKNTLKFTSSKRNTLCVNDMQYLQILSYKLQHTQWIIKKLNNKDNTRILLSHKINILSIWLNIKSEIDIENTSIPKLFDYYATLERLKVSKNYFSDISFENLYINHIEKDFWWNWALWLKSITKKLLIKKNITKYNPAIVEKIVVLRKKWINNLLKTIAIAENTNENYNAIYSNWNQHKIKYTQMTIKEVLKDMKKRIKTKWSSATWKYQFMYLTLKTLSKTYKIDINTQLFSEQFQEKIARIKLKERWLEKFIKWSLKRDDFQVNLSAEWASLAKDKSWKSYHHRDWVNKAFCSNEKIDSVLDSIKNPKPATNTLVASL